MDLKYFDAIDGAWYDVSGNTGSGLEYDGSGWVTTGGYKRFVAKISQYGTDDPEVIVYENTFQEDFVIYRNEASAYIINSPNNLFTENKTFFTNNQYEPIEISSDRFKYITLTYNDTNSILIKTYKINGGSWTEEDDLLRDFKIEIRVYN
jgi:hypothetical protein